MATTIHPLVATLTTLLCREGGPFSRPEDRPLHQARIEAEFSSGQWVLLTGDGNKLLGWLAWYRCDDETFEALKQLKGDQWAIDQRMTWLDEGPNLFLTDTVVAPWAPSWTYRRLYELAKARNPDAQVVGAWMIKRDGEYFHEREMKWVLEKAKAPKAAAL
ncbi:MAG: hypothetical protein RPU59_14050 [Candidatus Sedimenticola sp. (ex Thyasira tokunagai)]